MSRRCHGSLAALLVVSLAVVTACGGNSPSGPTPIDQPPAAAALPTPAPAPTPAPGSDDGNSEQTVRGAIASVSGTCPGKQLSVGGKTVVLTADTQYQAGATCAALAAGVVIEAEGRASGDTVTARKLGIEDAAGGGNGGNGNGGNGNGGNGSGGGDDNGADVSLTGAVSDLGGACPNLSFSIGSRRVALSASTQYRLGATCAAITRGAVVEVEGVISGGILNARTLKFEDDPAQPDVSVTGAISGLAGSCPNRTFRVGTRTIVLNASTQYLLGATCAALANGAIVEVEGPASGSTITARKLKFEDGPAGDTVLRGTVSAKGGACPAITFTVQGRTVVTSAATEFRKLTCAQVVDGTIVEAEGTLRGNTLDAKKVQLED